MNKIIHVTLLVFCFLNCSTLKNDFILDKYSIRYIGNEHKMNKYGIKTTRGIRVTNDEELDEKLLVESYDFKVFRNHELLKNFSNQQELYCEEISEFLLNELKYLDSISFENVIIKKGKRLNVGSIIYLHRIED